MGQIRRTNSISFRPMEFSRRKAENSNILSTVKQVRSWLKKEENNLMSMIFEKLGKEDGMIKRGWGICGPANVAVSRILSYKTGLPVGRGLSGDHIELQVGIYDSDGTERTGEQTFIKMYLKKKIVYIDPTIELGRGISFWVFNSEKDLQVQLKLKRHINQFGPHYHRNLIGPFKKFSSSELGQFYRGLLDLINSESDWKDTKKTILVGDKEIPFRLHDNISAISDIINAYSKPERTVKNRE